LCDLLHDIGHIGLWFDAIEFAGLCPSQNYAEWLERLAIKLEELRGIEE
jgi:hypothetical protein